MSHIWMIDDIKIHNLEWKIMRFCDIMMSKMFYRSMLNDLLHLYIDSVWLSGRGI